MPKGLRRTAGVEGLRVSAHGNHDIVITRSFAAPRVQVFEAVSQADFLRRWLVGPAEGSVTECECDFRIGGNRPQS